MKKVSYEDSGGYKAGEIWYDPRTLQHFKILEIDEEIIKVAFDYNPLGQFGCFGKPEKLSPRWMLECKLVKENE